MIEGGDFRVSRPSQALERLEAALAQARVVSVRMPLDLAAAVSDTAARLGRPVGHLVREAVAYYLAAAAAYGAGQPAEADPGAATPAVDVDVQDESGVEEAFYKKAR